MGQLSTLFLKPFGIGVRVCTVAAPSTVFPICTIHKVLFRQVKASLFGSSLDHATLKQGLGKKKKYVLSDVQKIEE